MNPEEHKKKIAEIIKNYSVTDWTIDDLMKPEKGNIFRDSFQEINSYLNDKDLALWYLSFGQSFGGRTEPMHQKMSKLCTKSEKNIISFKENLPENCPYYNSGNLLLEKLKEINYDNSDCDKIKAEIDNLFSGSTGYSRCEKEDYDNCPNKDNCPVAEWEKIIKEKGIRYTNHPRIFFYYDTMMLLNNSYISSFSDLFNFIIHLTPDNQKQTVTILALLENIRGIKTKVRMFLQMENIYLNRNLDYLELIFVDRLVVRVAERIGFPGGKGDLNSGIKKFCEKSGLNPREVDIALWDAGKDCPINGCNEECIFKEVCIYSDSA
jgi:hypothetical protein